ncbi:MAG: COX15/CtaA family protein [Hyphomicrobiaceae bacterium]
MAVIAARFISSPHDAIGAAPVVKLWLTTTIGLVFAMIVVGGATRLTNSGLSITEWQPILGVIPPLTEADWQDALEKYRQIPQYREINRGMSMAEFQFIYWWEWAHRFLGRLIGVVYGLPLLVFWVRGMLPTRHLPLMVGLLLLGGLQGFVGWYMVQSGLVERTEVSQYRLALHLSIAFVILSLLVWLRLAIEPERRSSLQSITLKTISPAHVSVAIGLVALVFAQVALGAFVAGTKAGLTYNTWPLMDGRLIPNGVYGLDPWWVSIGEDITTIQFNHRMSAYVLTIVAVWHAVVLALTADCRRTVVSANILAISVLLQSAIGIATLLYATNAIPIGLGLAHQAGGAVVMAIAVWHSYAIRRATAA